MKKLLKYTGIIVGAGITAVVIFIILIILVLAASSPDGDEERSQAQSFEKSNHGPRMDREAKDDTLHGLMVLNADTVDVSKEYGFYETNDLKVKNVSEEKQLAWFEIRLLNDKGNLVGVMDCIGDELDPGQKQSIDCTSIDDYKPGADNFEIQYNGF